MKKMFLFLMLTFLSFQAFGQFTISNSWNQTGAAGQQWQMHNFRDIAINNTGGTYDGRAYITHSNTSAGNYPLIIFYDKAAWIGGTAPDTGSYGSFGDRLPDNTAWSTGPYGIDVASDEYVYVGAYSTKKIVRYNGDGTGGVILNQPDGSTDLVLSKNPRGIRTVGSGASTMIYYGEGAAVSSPNVYSLTQSGSGWVENLLFTSPQLATRGIQSVLKHPTADTIYLTLNGSPYMEKWYHNGSAWVEVPIEEFAITGFPVSQFGSANFVGTTQDYIVAPDGSNRTLNIIATSNGSRLVGVNYGVSGLTFANATGADSYDNSTVFGVGSRQSSTGPVNFGCFEKATVSPALPVELTSFTSTSNGSAITLNWATATEVDNYGFEVERSADNTTFTKVGFVAGAGNSNVQRQYSFIDENLTNGTYYYRLKQVDTDGSFEYSQVVSSSVSETPATFSLDQNYPNPFNPSTKISFALAKDSDVKLSVFNTLGEEVAVLINSTLTAGNHSVDFNASNLTSGMYLYKIQAGEFVSVKKMTLAK